MARKRPSLELRHRRIRRIGTLGVLLALVGGTGLAGAAGEELTLAHGTAGQEVLLQWTGAAACHGVFRSNIASSILAPGNRLGETVALAWLDSTPAGPGQAIFFRVESDCAASPPWDTTWTHTQGDPALDGEQEPPRDLAPSPEATRIGPVMVHSGEVMLTLPVPGLAIPGRGAEHWSAPLVYRSQILFDSCVGSGWNLRHVTDRAMLEPGGIRRYDAGRARIDLFDGGSRTAPGYFQTFDVATPGFVSFREHDGLRRTYFDFSQGTAAGALSSIRDRQGNLVELDHDAAGRLFQAVDSMGRKIDYFYAVSGHLDRITDYIGRQAVLLQAGGQLLEVTSPPVNFTPHDDDGISFNGLSGNDFPSGKTYRFAYDTANLDPLLRDNLLSVTFPNEVATGGPARLTFTYGTNPVDPLTYDRVVSMAYGGGQVNIDPVAALPTGVPSGGTFTFGYQDLAPRTPGDLVTEIRKTTVTDPNGNVTEHFFNSQFREVRRVVQTNRNVNLEDPSTFTTLRAWNADALPTSVTLPEGNKIEMTYDGGSPNRFSQGNLLSMVDIPDPARGGDQFELRTTYTYDPIYNLRRTVTTPRGDDPIYIPPIPDNPAGIAPLDLNLDGDGADPADGETVRRRRYTSVRLFDYQESSALAIENLALVEGVDLDLDGSGPLTAPVVAQALSLGGALPVDLNGDGSTAQQVGNVVESRLPNVLLPGGGVQERVSTLTYNARGQMTSHADPEGNLTTHYYFPENDPDGNTLSEGLVRPGVDTVTGGYLRLRVRDDDPGVAATPAIDPLRPAGQPVTNAGTARRTRTAPFTLRRAALTYDPIGNLTGAVDGRGIRTDYVVNELNQVVQATRAAATGVYAPDPPEVLPLTSFTYRARYFYDFNDNVIRVQIEDRGNTSVAGGDNPGGVPFIDHVYVYDLLDRRIREVHEVSDSEDLTTLHRYDPNGNPVLRIEPEGNARAALYDERDLLFQSTRGVLSPPPLALISPSDPVSFNVRGGLPSTDTFTYDGNSNLAESADAEDTDLSPANNSAIPGTGDRTRLLFDGFDRRTGIVDSVGNQAVIQYDPDGNAVRLSRFGPVGGASPVADGPTPLLRPVSSLGVLQPASLVSTSLLAATELAHDSSSRLFQADRVLFVNSIATLRAPDVDDGAVSLGKGDLTPAGGLPIPGLTGLAVIGRVSTRTGLDRNSMSTSRTEDDLDVTSYAYDGLDRLIRVVDPEGNSIERAYDDTDNLIEIQEKDVSQVPGITDELFLTTYVYDSLNRMTLTVDNLGHANLYRYDARDNRVAAADAVGPVTGATIGRRAFAPGPLTINSINDPGNVVQYDYDGLDRLIRTTRVLTASGGGDGINIGATSEGIKTAVPAPDPAQGGGDGLIMLARDWDGNSLKASSTDDDGNRTEYAYDNLDRLIRKTYGICTAPLLADRCDPPTLDLYDLDLDDNIIGITDENGSITQLDYDALDRVLSKQVARAPSIVGTTQTTYEYDGLSRITRATDDNDPAVLLDDSTATRAYDSLSRVIEESQKIGPLPVRAIDQAWRAEDLRAGLTYPDGRLLEYQYDGLDRIRRVSDIGLGDGFDTRYFGRSRIAQRDVYPFLSNHRMTYLDPLALFDAGYDGLRRPVQIDHLRADNSRIVGLAGTFDRAHNRVSEDKLHDFFNNEIYTHDSAYRTTQFLRPDPLAQPPAQSSWSLDGAGNWKSVDGETRQHSSFNEIISRTSGPSFVPVVSDDNGNITEDGTFFYAWDYLDRLRAVTSMATGLVVAEYAYDAFGRRIRSVLSPALAGPVTDFYYCLGDTIEEHNGLDLLTQQYVRGSGGADLVLLSRDVDGDGSATGAPDQQLFYHRNMQGSVFGMTGPGAVVTEGYQYEAYGQSVVYEPGFNGVIDFGGDDLITPGGEGSAGNPYRWRGARFDSETGLYLMGSSHYSPTLGRFLSRGSSGGWGGTTPQGNSYMIADANPTSRPIVRRSSDRMRLDSPSQPSRLEVKSYEIRIRRRSVAGPYAGTVGVRIAGGSSSTGVGTWRIDDLVIDPPAPPPARFTFEKVGGSTVRFMDASENQPRHWEWSFSDGCSASDAVAGFTIAGVQWPQMRISPIVNYKFKLFNPSGVPLRGKISVKLQQYAPANPTSKPKHSDATPVKSGSSWEIDPVGDSEGDATDDIIIRLPGGTFRTPGKRGSTNAPPPVLYGPMPPIHVVPADPGDRGLLDYRFFDEEQDEDDPFSNRGDEEDWQ